MTQGIIEIKNVMEKNLKSIELFKISLFKPVSNLEDECYPVGLVQVYSVPLGIFPYPFSKIDTNMQLHA